LSFWTTQLYTTTGHLTSFLAKVLILQLVLEALLVVGAVAPNREMRLAMNEDKKM
jgi:hypothetical protein